LTEATFGVVMGDDFRDEPGEFLLAASFGFNDSAALDGG